MVLSILGSSKIDDLIAVPRLVVVALSFLPVAMPNVVGIIFLELFRVNVMLPAEFRLPEEKRLFHGQADTFEEETEL